MRHYKSLLCALLAIGLCMGPRAANAEEGASPSPSVAPTPTVAPTPSQDPDYVAIGVRGEYVARMQQRLKDLGYYNYKPTGYFMYTTRGCLIDFQNRNGILADGSAGQETKDLLFSNNALRKRLPVYNSTGAESNPFQTTGQIAVWGDISRLITEGTTFEVIDQETSVSFQMQRVGGTNHMEIEPVDQQNNRKITDMIGNGSIYQKRPVLVHYGNVYYAASIYLSPHGADLLPGNGMEGHICLYFQGSTPNDIQLTDQEHQDNIQRAAGQEN